MAGECPEGGPHNYVTIATTTDSNGNIVRATLECNKCGDIKYV